MRFPRTPQRLRGFFVVDAIVGLILLSALATVLAVAVNARARGAAALESSRAALRAADAALIELQAGAGAPSERASLSVKIFDVDNAGLEAPSGTRWVRVEATTARKTVSLHGVVPAQAAPSRGRR